MKNLEILTNAELIASLKSLVGDERSVVVAVLKHLSEFDDRRLAAKTGFPSLFDYCVRELRYAQGEAFRRIRAARAAEKFKVLYRLLERGALTLTAVALLEPHLKWDNHRRLIRAAKGLSTREVEAFVASLCPVPAAPPERIRFIAVGPPVLTPPAADLFTALERAPSAPTETPAPSASAETPAPPPTNSPPPPSRRVEFSFTGDEALFRDVERVKELSRHKWPAGRLEDVFAGAIKTLLARIDPDKRERRKERVRRLAAGVRGRGRRIAQAVKDEVWRRDGGRCSYPAPVADEEPAANPAAGMAVCGSRASLEFDHVRPWALGGSNEAWNIRLLCRTHNDLEARRVFGEAAIDGALDRRR